MHHVLIVYSSQTGRTARLVQAAADGMAEFADTVTVRTRKALEADTEDLLWAHGLLLATPENLAYMSGALKDFFDRTYYPAEGRTVGLPCALLISAGNDGSGAQRAIERIATGYRWKMVAPALIVKGDPDAAGLMQARELGQTLAAGLSVGAF